MVPIQFLRFTKLLHWSPLTFNSLKLHSKVKPSGIGCCAKSLQSCPTLCNPMDCSPPGSSVQGVSRLDTGVGNHFLLQGIFPTQGSKLHLLCLLHWQAASLSQCHLIGLGGGWGSPQTYNISRLEVEILESRSKKMLKHCSRSTRVVI